MTQHLKHFIEGALVDASDGARMSLVSPVDEQEYATAARGTAEDVQRAVAAARAQLEGGGWSRLDGAQRARLLSKLADLVERDAALLADMDANAIGRSPMEPRMMDVPNAVANLRAAAGWANQLEGRTIPTGGYMGTKTLSYTIREPIGRAGAGRRATQVARVQAGNGTTQHGADESLQQPGDVHIAHLPRRSGSSAMQVDFTFGPGMAFHR